MNSASTINGDPRGNGDAGTDQGTVMTTTPEVKLQLSMEDVVWREVGDELVILELSTSTYLTLNGTAKHLWEQLADGTTSELLVESLVERYGITTAQAAADAEAFVGALSDRGLLSRSG